MLGVFPNMFSFVTNAANHIRLQLCLFAHKQLRQIGPLFKRQENQLLQKNAQTHDQIIAAICSPINKKREGVKFIIKMQRDLEDCHQYSYSQTLTSFFQASEDSGHQPTKRIATEPIQKNILWNYNVILKDPPNKFNPSDSRKWPFSCIGLISAKLSNNTQTFGVGALIGSNIVLTCAHLLHSSFGDMATQVHFVAALHQNKGISFRASKWKVPSDYLRSGQPDKWDVGVVWLEQQYADKLIGRLGWQSKHLHDIGGFDRICWFQLGNMYASGDWLFRAEPEGVGNIKPYQFKNGAVCLKEQRGEYRMVGIYAGRQPVLLFDEVIKECIERLCFEMVGKVKPNQPLKIGGVRHLATSRLPDLVEIQLKANNLLGNDAMRELSRGKWERLTKLQLNQNNISDGGVHYLVKPFWPRLQYINLARNKIQVQGLRILCRSYWPILQSIILQHNNFGYLQLRCFLFSNWPFLEICAYVQTNIKQMELMPKSVTKALINKIRIRPFTIKTFTLNTRF